MMAYHLVLFWITPPHIQPARTNIENFVTTVIQLLKAGKKFIGSNAMERTLKFIMWLQLEPHFYECLGHLKV